jgi:hypothetical protein
MKRYLVSIKGNARELARQVNRLHAEIETLAIDAITKAIKAGELLSELKLRIGHGHWRTWIKANLHFSYRTASRYIRAFNYRDQIREAKVKTLTAATELLAEASSEHGMDATEADYRKIERDLVKPIRVVRGRLRKTTYRGDDDQKVTQILQMLREETRALLGDLEE